MTAKERIAKLVENIPDDASREEVLYRLRLFHNVELGLRDVEMGNVVDDDKLDDLLNDEEKGDDAVVHKVGGRPSRSKKLHRPRQAKGSEQIHQRPEKIRERA
jgi:hypothetical protein